MPILAVLVLVLIGVVAIAAYNIWHDFTQPPPAVDLQYPGSVSLLFENDPQKAGTDGLVGPVEDRVYGLPATQASMVNYQDILAWYHTQLVARGWSFLDANPLTQYLAGENWLQGCEYLSVRIWDPRTAQPSFNDPDTYPITFEVRQQSYCASS